MARSKCKYCNEEILTKDDKLVITEELKSGNMKRINLHKKCEEEYKELMEYKKNELYWFDQVYEQLKELLEYTSEQQLPKSLITRIQDLRNGTVLKRGEGRVIKSKEGYKYEIIFDCLLASGDSFKWAMKNNTFNKEVNKINYLMAIVENNINDSYELYISRSRNNRNNCNDIIEEEKKIVELEEKQKLKPIENNKNKKGILKFLEDDDF